MRSKTQSLPIITLLVSGLASTLGGSVIVEQIFTIPGVGMYMLSAIKDKNVPVVMTWRAGAFTDFHGGHGCCWISVMH